MILICMPTEYQTYDVDLNDHVNTFDFTIQKLRRLARSSRWLFERTRFTALEKEYASGKIAIAWSGNVPRIVDIVKRKCDVYDE